MMGKQDTPQSQLFYYNFNIDERIPDDHPLRHIKERVDFDFVSKKVEALYGTKGNVSIPPPVILKLAFLLFYDDVASERELMRILPLRLDWLWFLDFDLDSSIPNHSVLSKARARWGEEAFKEFFENAVWQCVRAGLVGGDKLFCDSSLVDADASTNSVMDRDSFKRYWKETYGRLERRFLDEDAGQKRHVSTTDPDASIVRKGKGKPKVRYAEHRAVDSKAGVITATVTTPGAVNEAHVLTQLIDGHQENTHRKAEVVVADSKYGTVANYLKLHDRGVSGHIPDLSTCQKSSSRRKGIFDISAFIYDEETDTYLCPAGNRLSPRKHKKKRKAVEYSASKKTCLACELYDKCTRSKGGVRTVKRHDRQKELDTMREISRSAHAKRDLKTRKHFMEGSYADAANNHGFKRSRWRGLEKISIQDFMIAAVQNIRILMKHWRRPSGTAQEAWDIGQQRVKMVNVFCESVYFFVNSLLPKRHFVNSHTFH